jgi:starch synthase
MLASMRVVLSTPGVFHHFALARELERRHHLGVIYTTYPWLRVKRESLPRSKVRTFPWIHPAQLALRKRLRWSQRTIDRADTLTANSFDRYVAATLPPCDYLIAMSGSGLRAGRRAQERGATYICDRGSTHIRYQIDILNEEHARWGCAGETPRSASIAREEAEYAAADLILVPSEFSFRSFVAQGVPAAKLRKVVLAADVKRFYPVAQPDGNEFCVLYVGQISFRKGIPYLLEAFRQFDHPHKRLRLVGNVEDRIKPYLRTAPLDNVQFDGPQPLDHVRQAMSTAHVTVLPSIEDGFGMVLAEAMACGSPVISSVNTGGADLYESGREGFVVPIRDPKALRDAIQLLADDAALRGAMSQAAVERMRHLGGWSHYGDTIDALLLKERALSA